MGQGLQTLFEHYQLLEQSFPLKDIDAKYTNLVTANGNQQFPVQRWFHLKEAFSIDLLEILLTDWNIPSESVCRILDPFCGIGTTLLASQKLAKKHARTDIEAIGIERNPFLHFVAQTKMQCVLATWSICSQNRRLAQE
jgi:DNA modification methylase